MWGGMGVAAGPDQHADGRPDAPVLAAGHLRDHDRLPPAMVPQGLQGLPPLRWLLAFLGCLGFQGSIKWWVLRHRLHHRWTDSEFDPYNSKKGLFFSHMGWIFRKPKYEKLKLIDQSDLNQDPVVRFQHKYYVPMSLFMGFVLPYILGEWVLKSNRHSRLDGLIWAGFVARILIWHFTFLINSFAHYYGERAFDLDISARSNFLLALFTGGEANHNYHHVFPKDYRNGPDSLDWDPSKWIIYLLHRYTSLVPKINYTDSREVEEVRQRVLKLTSSRRRDGRASKFEDIHQISLLSSSSSSSSDRDDGEDAAGSGECSTATTTTKRRGGRAARTPAPVPRWKRDEMLAQLAAYHARLVRQRPPRSPASPAPADPPCSGSSSSTTTSSTSPSTSPPPPIPAATGSSSASCSTCPPSTRSPPSPLLTPAPFSPSFPSPASKTPSGSSTVPPNSPSNSTPTPASPGLR
ncbi:hypothetical protein PTTG_28817 [Puccinia triticina 1-1 BBBD Race 1]|uniref:FA_desaturase domain-containing protein n=1 Tax=Puccinia triticina (isolate 1-1 / race 1 (BBBD)) TaxID=630390 RepID=A0A180G8P5_PUCT1|nr:hypothetical protein PTTG_28817 [Puccinia triticina 1-1 BBBD Race 1]